METTVWKISTDEAAASQHHAAIEDAARLLRAGELVAFPTETVYGLGADARSSAAVEAIYAAKGRPSDNPLIVHIAERAQLDELVSEAISAAERELAERLMAHFWPGPLTIVVPVRPGAVSPRVTAGLATVAVRMPDHPLALALIRAAGCPVAAPSANRSGRPSPTTAAHVERDLGGLIAGIIDGGPTAVGLESTVVAVGPRGLELLRPGGVTQQQLREALPDAALTLAPELTTPLITRATAATATPGAADASAAAPADAAPAGSAADPAAGHSAPRSPGMKYAHYAPQGEMRLVMSAATDAAGALDAADGAASSAAVAKRAATLLAAAKQQGKRVGVLTYAEHAACYEGVDHVAVCGSMHDLNTVAQQLYDSLRSFDEARIDYIVAEACPPQGVGEAIMNRLLKAAAYRVEIVEAVEADSD